MTQLHIPPGIQAIVFEQCGNMIHQLGKGWRTLDHRLADAVDRLGFWSYCGLGVDERIDQNRAIRCDHTELHDVSAERRRFRVEQANAGAAEQIACPQRRSFAVMSAHLLERLAGTLLTSFALLQPEGTVPAAVSACVRLPVGGLPRFFECSLLRLTELPFRNRRILVKQVRVALAALPGNRGDDWPAWLQAQRRELIARLVVTRRLIEPAVVRYVHAISIRRLCDSDRHLPAHCIGFGASA
jgi:hypothetical protein